MGWVLAPNQLYCVVLCRRQQTKKANYLCLLTIISLQLSSNHLTVFKQCFDTKSSAASLVHHSSYQLHTYVCHMLVFLQQLLYNNRSWVQAQRWTDGVDIAPIIFFLRMLQRISIHLTGTRKQKPGSHSLCQPQHIQCTHHICFVSKVKCSTTFLKQTDNPNLRNW